MKFTSPVYSAASGSIAGVVYSRSAQGMYTRARAVPVNPNSTRQQIMRMYLDTAVTFWTETLTEPERESWRVYAANVAMTDRLGASMFLSGQQQWTRSATMWLLKGGDLADIATAPAIFDTGDPGTLILLGALTTGVITLGIAGAPAWAADADAAIFGFVGNPQNPSVNFYKGPFRFMGVIPGNATPITSAAFDADNATPPVALAVGQRIWVRVRVIYPDGRLTQAFMFNIIVA
jgi:hypothetical protein